MDEPTLETAPDGGAMGEADPASVSAFRFDEYLVTVGRFRQFVNAWMAAGVQSMARATTLT